ncbi:MAG: hypothetical protein ACE5OY_06805 [Candidatus Bathyarchaeia archaeon]
MITELDLYYLGSLVFVVSALLANVWLRQLFLVYLTILLALGFMGYKSRGHVIQGYSMRDLWTMAILSSIIYPLVDYSFEARLRWVTYLTDEPKLLATPVYVILFWVYGVFLFGYFFLRVRDQSGRDLRAGALTGLYAALSASLIENLFNVMGFYRNAESFLMIGYVPLYVSLGWV